MTSRASWLNVSLIKENFKRFWPIMCGGFLFWLVCGPIALVLTKSSEGYSYSFMRSILRHINPAPILLNGILPVALVLSACAFFRALGDPLPEDVENDYFRLVPEQTGTKLWYSLLGGAACIRMLAKGACQGRSS